MPYGNHVMPSLARPAVSPLPVVSPVPAGFLPPIPRPMVSPRSMPPYPLPDQSQLSYLHTTYYDSYYMQGTTLDPRHREFSSPVYKDAIESEIKKEDSNSQVPNGTASHSLSNSHSHGIVEHSHPEYPPHVYAYHPYQRPAYYYYPPYPARPEGGGQH